MEALHGKDLLAGFGASVRLLERHRDAIDALNVYPVPDGDTGINMLLTLRAAVEKADTGQDAAAGAVAALLADGAFWGARGNSGVIFSQFMKGFAQKLAGQQTAGGPALAVAFAAASEAAYRAVAKPVEGTMLTVMRCAAEQVQTSLSQGTTDAAELWSAGFQAAADALAATPSQLPALKEAGVVDAGGMGVVVILAGLLRHWERLDDETLDSIVASGYRAGESGGVPRVGREFVTASQEVTWGYCTQFVVRGDGLSPDQLRSQMSGLADASSAVVVGDDRQVRVHVHLQDPGRALSLGVALGQLSEIKIENMSVQNHAWAEGHEAEAEIPPYPPSTSSGRRLYERGISSARLALVAVAPGPGLARLFQEAGCAAVVNGGPTMNPSVGQLLEAARATGAEEVILLPNDKNIIVAAQQAIGAPGLNLRVAPTRSVPQGVAAALAFNPEEPAERNLAAMQQALESVTTVEVTRAIRDASIGGVTARAGQCIGLVDGVLRVAADTPNEALLAALAQAGLAADKVVTIYWGEGAAQAQAQEAAQALQARTPGLEVQVVPGGQPHYPYLASVE